MKQNLGSIIKASAITLVVYIGFYTLWGAVANEIASEELKLIAVALVSSFVFAYVLLRTVKNKRFIGESEILSDYKDRKYTSPINDIKLAFRREVGLLLCITAVVFACYFLHGIDRLLAFDKRVISLPTFVFAPMCLFSEVVKVPFLGYVISAAVDCTAYIILLLIYRRNTYKRTQKNKRNPY